MEQSTQGWEVMRDREFLVLKLDRLLEEYLRTLDAYQQAQQQLTKHLSSVSILSRFTFLWVADLIFRVSCLWRRQISLTIRTHDMDKTTMMKGCRRPARCE